jgi:serine/threonine protein kinase/tetratricopeptide (TPR) repeat protein
VNRLQEQLKPFLSGRYELIREIGRGARAVVFLAEDLKNRRRVALKVLRPEFTASVGSSRFLREIQIAAGMTHPHILPLFDSGDAGGALFYVMPYVEGESLRDRIQREGTLPVGTAVELTRQVADALNYAHKQGVIHRDIKPENILLEDGEAVLADFGIARAIALASAETLTETGVSIGTPQYMSPEQIVGSRDVNEQTDVYALGCVLYEMLVGRPPFSAGTAQAVLAQHLSRDPAPPISIRSEIPPWLDHLVLRMLAKDPADRFDTAEALSLEIRHNREGEFASSSDRSLRWLYRIHKNRRPALAGALGLFILAAAFSALLRDRGREAPSTGIGPLPVSNIAVLPLEDVTGQDQGSLALGFSQFLSSSLGDVSGINVIQAQHMAQLREDGFTIDSIIKRFEVGTLIGGNLLRGSGEIQVSAFLTDANSMEHIGSVGPLVRPTSESPALLADLAEEVGRALRERLGFEVFRQEMTAGTECAECLDAFFQARDLESRAQRRVAQGDTGQSRELFARADSLLSHAEAVDRQWNDLTIERGWVDVLRARLFTSTSPAYDSGACRRGIAHAQRVLDRDPDNPRALELRGILRSYLAEVTTDAATHAQYWTGALEDLETAVERAPSLVAAQSRLSRMYELSGDYLLAKQGAERALRADAWLRNDETIIMRLCQASINLEDLEGWDHWCVEEGRKQFPGRLGFVSAELILLTSWSGVAADVQGAWALADTAVALTFPHRRESRRPQFMMDVAAVIARAGLPDSAMAVIQKARDIAPGPDPELDYREANARLQLGQTAEAINLLRRYLTTRPDRREIVAVDWWFRPLWDEPAFQALVGNTGG